MKTEFTKGECKIEKTNSRFVLNNGSIDIWFGDVTENQVLENEALANAKLIAAAPEMFKALMLLVKNLERFGYSENSIMFTNGELSKAKEAIKKATE